MSRQSEKVLRELTAYLEAHQSDNPSEEELNELVQQFMLNQNSQMAVARTKFEPTTADDYLELAENEPSKTKRMEYAKKALSLDADNLDAARMVAELKAKQPYELLCELARLVEKGNRLMMREGYFAEEFKGEFWGVLETRPYMRLRHLYMQTLAECGRIRRAVRECEEMLDLCENDNLGVRFDLMHLYALLEEEEPANALLKRYPDGETQTLLPLSVLHFKLGQTDQALEDLKRLNKLNKDTKKFLNAARKGEFERYITEMSPYGYRPFSIEELIIEVSDYPFLFDSVPYYFDWAYQSLKKEKASKQ